jgi:hypothetical protein
VKNSEILDAAAAVIDVRGWHQGGFVPSLAPVAELDTCPVCVLGAITVACGNDPEDFSQGNPIRAASALAEWLSLPDRDAEDLEVVVGDRWNDDPIRTADQVTRALRAAAASEREAGR